MRALPGSNADRITPIRPGFLTIEEAAGVLRLPVYQLLRRIHNGPVEACWIGDRLMVPASEVLRHD